MKLPSAFVNKSEQVNVIIETHKGCGNKYTFDSKTELFKLSKILPEGSVLPLHFSFIPHKIINFFIACNKMNNKKITPRENKDHQTAIRLIKDHVIK